MLVCSLTVTCIITAGLESMVGQKEGQEGGAGRRGILHMRVENDCKTRQDTEGRPHNLFDVSLDEVRSTVHECLLQQYSDNEASDRIYKIWLTCVSTIHQLKFRR